MFNKFQQDLRQYGRAFLPIILTVLFGMQIMRVLLLSFVGYLRDSLDIGSLELAPVAVGIFALSLLAAPINRFLGTQNALWLTSGGLAFLRLIEQFVSDPSLDYYLSALGVALFLCFIPIALGSARAQAGAAPRHFALAFLLGLSLDSAIFIAANTLDLSWQSGYFAIGIVLILVGLHLSLLTNYVANSMAAIDTTWKSAVAFLAFGPWLFLQALLFQNTGLFGSLIGYYASAAGFTLLAANALALYMLPRLAGMFSNLATLIISLLLFAALLYVLPQSSFVLAMALLLLGQIASYAFIYALFQVASEQGKAGLAASSSMFGLGQILFILFLFIYYASYDINFGIRSGLIFPIAAILMLLFSLPAQKNLAAAPNSKPTNSVAIAAALLLILPLAKMLAVSAPLDLTPSPDRVRVMDYNLHNAVNTSGRLDPEALAQVIEASGAEIIAFQEISRGWLTWGGLDMLTWFADRLDMYYVWGPTADPQWGNALFSRYPIESYELLDLPPDDVLLLRGHINATIDLGANSLNVIATHFSHRDDQGEERLLQSSALLSTWNSRPSTIIMGDLNAEPDTAEIRLLIDHGLVDISAEIGAQPTYTYYADDPDHQIDYILASPDLGYSHFIILQSSASDHLPLAATLHFDQ